ncbi:MAG TPA: hypothetical protein VHX44_12185 [Planctomycetota bacterium]|nr:hypothetical protein [Planctomycetota bacterium]
MSKETNMIEKKDPGVAPAVWQELDGWHVRVHHAGAVRVFATRDEAISFSTSTYTDGATAARAETQRGEVAQTAAKAVAKSAPRPTQVPKRTSESGNESGL